jgi:prolipoprotein diacylglyceryltransferase
MKLLAFILIMSGAAIGAFAPKRYQPKLQFVAYPLFGIGLILAGVGNFLTGEMVGKERVGFISRSLRDKLMTMESDPAQFIIVNSLLILGGVAVLFWLIFLRKR